MKLLKFLLEDILGESTAAEEAHRLGLSYAGYGKWKDKNGKTVAKTVDGKLVKMEPDSSSADATTDDSQTGIKRGRGRPPKPSAYDHTTTNLEQRDNFTIHPNIWGGGAGANPAEYKKYREPEWYSKPNKNVAGKFKKVLRESKTMREFVRGVADIMGVDPWTTVYTNDEHCDQIHVWTGTTSYGLYSASARSVMLSKEVTRKIDELLRMSHLSFKEHLYNAPIDPDKNPAHYKQWEQIMEAMSGLKTVLHEFVHAKDSYLDPENDTTDHSPLDRFIYEALTESKAQRLLNEMVTDDHRRLSYMPQSKIGSYRREVSALHALEDLIPTAPQQLWETKTEDERRHLLNLLIEQGIVSKLEEVFKSNDEEDWSDDLKECLNIFNRLKEKAGGAAQLYMTHWWPALAHTVRWKQKGNVTRLLRQISSTDKDDYTLKYYAI